MSLVQKLFLSPACNALPLYLHECFGAQLKPSSQGASGTPLHTVSLTSLFIPAHIHHKSVCWSGVDITHLPLEDETLRGQDLTQV